MNHEEFQKMVNLAANLQRDAGKEILAKLGEAFPDATPRQIFAAFAIGLAQTGLVVAVGWGVLAAVTAARAKAK